MHLFVGHVLIRVFPAALHTAGAPAGGNNFTVLVSLKVIQQDIALKFGTFSHWSNEMALNIHEKGFTIPKTISDCKK